MTEFMIGLIKKTKYNIKTSKFIYILMIRQRRTLLVIWLSSDSRRSAI